jgi:hypothetical protein
MKYIHCFGHLFYPEANKTLERAFGLAIIAAAIKEP